MIPATFDYVRAESVDAALAALAEHGEEAKLLAGGHSLLPLMKLRLTAPAVLVDIARIPELRYIHEAGDEVVIGAASRHHDLETSELLRTEVPLLAHVASLVGDRQVRARGTLGGSLVHGDPASDLPTAVLALDATLVLHGPTGRREIAATEFFTDFFQTVAGPDEILVEVRVPRTGNAGWGYEKFTVRNNDWPIVAAAAVDGRVALANMGPTVLRASATERALIEGATVADAAAVADAGTTPAADGSASAEYRRHLARLLTRRALTTAAAK